MRIALGGVAHAPWRAHDAEAALRGAAGDGGRIRARRRRRSSLQAGPLRDNAFKVPLARRLIVRTLTELGHEHAHERSAPR